MVITFFMFKVDIRVRKLYCVNKAMPTLPINIEDAARSDAEIEAALQIFRQFMLSEGFVEIHTPKLIAGSSEGGSAIFKLDYKGQPQLANQMAIYRDFGRDFEIGLRVENSYTGICVNLRVLMLKWRSRSTTLFS
ncbi:hypothetical protein PVK06_002852 [Gossypium arboreum]|uniref:Aminoacyl-tRNA synthetase class II (D/K/N) domain-containing protein n=1 Tax=Gossypium arboreum TaxID=29729 RepID=A0ABR0R5W4_GOSAR|nr:hypothetical protein PVK06_002852 [Gossypium arboreum]